MSVLSRLEAVKRCRDQFPHIFVDDNISIFRNSDGKLWLTRPNPRIDPQYEEYEDVEIDTPKKLLSVIKQYFEKHPLVYVNAYSVERCYGGAAEGGWWYDDYEPLASVPVLKKNDNVERAERMITEALAWDNPRGRGSVIGGPDFVIMIQDHPAKHEPERRPRYE